MAHCKSAGSGQAHPGGRVSHLVDLRQGARVRHSGDSNDSEPPPPYSMEVQQRCHTPTPSRFLRNTPDLDSDTDDLGLRVVRIEAVKWLLEYRTIGAGGYRRSGLGRSRRAGLPVLRPKSVLRSGSACRRECSSFGYRVQAKASSWSVTRVRVPPTVGPCGLLADGRSSLVCSNCAGTGMVSAGRPYQGPRPVRLPPGLETR
jgi:hypothetical protein